MVHFTLVVKSGDTLVVYPIIKPSISPENQNSQLRNFRIWIGAYLQGAQHPS